MNTEFFPMQLHCIVIVQKYELLSLYKFVCVHEYIVSIHSTPSWQVNRYIHFRSSQDSPSHGASLLNTAITEEEVKQGASPSTPTKQQHVINMDHMAPGDGPTGDETKL